MGEELLKSVVGRIAVIAVIIVLAYFLVARPVMRRLGILETAEDKKRDKEREELATSLKSPFNPKYWTTVPDPVLMTRAFTEGLADQIDGAIGNFYDDENTVYGAMRQLKTKTQLSWLADIFFQRHKMDLFTLLNRNLGTSEMEVVIGIANNLS